MLDLSIKDGIEVNNMPLDHADEITAGFEKYVELAYGEELITAYPDNTFRLSCTAIRAEASGIYTIHTFITVMLFALLNHFHKPNHNIDNFSQNILGGFFIEGHIPGMYIQRFYLFTHDNSCGF